ncbi:hypothetical protein RHSIM_Rhsim06G0107900 [Rhododendron simsii]|uniref:Uncharacterized protein n=1 Tax=Rhododendron simsii TaxID=118357 RepID=A0A834LLG2_RHOSS|nr:hypothetical protein RHSIM_Rhsim06G0107900 [Rhododendron simsii]
MPLGYHSSWPFIRLMTHQFVVWYCARKVHLDPLFTDYAVLGDDVIIADEAGAKVYRVKT